MQFGRLKNDLPTFQIAPQKYFVLIPLGELERQPSREGAGAGRGANRATAPAANEAPAKAEGREPEVVVDHRKSQTSVRDQGHRGTCVAFAACAELEALLKAAGATHDLSENLAYYWFMEEEQGEPCKDPGLATYRVAGYLQKHLVGEEKEWPYVPDDPADLAAAGQCDKVNKPLPGAIREKEGFGVDRYQLLPQGSEVKPGDSFDIRDTATLERLLSDGHEIVFGTIVAWRNADAKGIIDVTLGPAGQPIFGAGGHAMLIVGFRKLSNPAELF